jgi:sirohydrochlorin ferrochelatase
VAIVSIGLLLVAHGSRHAEANDDLHHLAAELRRRGSHGAVETAFLEIAEPTIDQAALRCVEQQVARVILVPYFLSAGVHVQRDLAAARQRLAERYPQVEFLLAEPLGRHPLLIDMVIERAQEVMQQPKPTDSGPRVVAPAST